MYMYNIFIFKQINFKAKGNKISKNVLRFDFFFKFTIGIYIYITSTSTTSLFRVSEKFLRIKTTKVHFTFASLILVTIPIPSINCIVNG